MFGLSGIQLQLQLQPIPTITFFFWGHQNKTEMEVFHIITDRLNNKPSKILLIESCLECSFDNVSLLSFPNTKSNYLPIRLALFVCKYLSIIKELSRSNRTRFLSPGSAIKVMPATAMARIKKSLSWRKDNILVLFKKAEQAPRLPWQSTRFKLDFWPMTALDDFDSINSKCQKNRITYPTSNDPKRDVNSSFTTSLEQDNICGSCAGNNNCRYPRGSRKIPTWRFSPTGCCVASSIFHLKLPFTTILHIMPLQEMHNRMLKGEG